MRDVARAVVLALTEGRNGERYIITAHNKEMLEFTKMVLQASGNKSLLFPVSGLGILLLDALLWIMDVLKLNPGIRRPSEMAVDKALSWEKIRQEMGWEPMFTLEQSIIDSVSGN